MVVFSFHNYHDKEENKLKKTLKVLALTLLTLVLIFGVYAAYVFMSYSRIADNQPIETVRGEAVSEAVLKTDQEYSALSYNIGFGAYLPDFSFFMDGGESSWAKSRESVIETTKSIGDFTLSFQPDFSFFQEVDINSTRSYHVNQVDILSEALNDRFLAFALNFDSAFLFYPIYQPHGKSVSGLALYSKYPISETLRRSLPVSTSFSKILDLDRCYTISRVPVENGKELVLFHIHMSAYGNSAEIREGQISMLASDMKKEYEAGNYVICGGDYNHDLKAVGEELSDPATWAHPFPREALPKNFSLPIDQFNEQEKAALWNTTRNADMPYDPEKTYTLTVDGFIVSDNVVTTHYEHINTGYLYSDHEPVLMKFKLKK